MSVPNLTIKNGTGTDITATGLGGGGTKASPAEWRVTSANPIAFQPHLMQYGERVKGVNRVYSKIWTPYVITNVDTNEQSSPAYCEIITVANFSPIVPQGIVNDTVFMNWSFMANSTVYGQMITQRSFAS
jgi:hypothetical protein